MMGIFLRLGPWIAGAFFALCLAWSLADRADLRADLAVEQTRVRGLRSDLAQARAATKRFADAQREQAASAQRFGARLAAVDARRLQGLKDIADALETDRCAGSPVIVDSERIVRDMVAADSHAAEPP